MYDSIFPNDLLKGGKTLLKEKKIKNIIFSSGTYQVEVEENGKDQWTFVQVSNKGEFTDLFCECGGSKNSPCIHLAASLLAIYKSYQAPMHIRYETSFWKILFEISAQNFGYNRSCLQKVGESYLSFDKKGDCLKITPLTSRAKEHFKITVDQRVEETEDTSIKFSNLEKEELINWRNGDPSDKLQYELSFWSDLAKYLLFLEEEGEKIEIFLLERDKMLPSGIEIKTNDFIMLIPILESSWGKLAPSLAPYETNLKVHESRGQQVEKITYNREKGVFSIKSNKVALDICSDAIDIGEWKFLPKLGFYPKFDDPLLESGEISEEKVEQVLDKYKDKFPLWLDGETVHPTEEKVQFDLEFDEYNNLHINAYLFEKGDLKEEMSKSFGKWIYIKDKGFYKVSGFLFEGVEKVVKNKFLSEFIDRHKSFLSKYDGFNIHLTNIESSVRYTFKDEVLEILRDKLHEEESGVVDCGKYLYVKGQGFFIQGDGRLDRHVFPGMKIEKEELSNFITTNKEELERVSNFFVPNEGLDKTGLMVTYVDELGIQIEPKYYFTEMLMKYDPKVYGDYVYLSNKGFIEIPKALRLPEKYQKTSIIEKNQMPFFLKHDLPKIKPYIIHLDTRLVVPSKLSLRVKYLEKVKGVWRFYFTFNSPLGEVKASEVYNAYMNFAAFLLSEAGMLILKDEKFHWLMRFPSERINIKDNMIEFSTLDWIKLTVTEDVYLPASSNDPIQEQLLKILKELHLDHISEMPIIKGLKSTLRPYQEIGVKWLWFLYSLGLPGGFLCDDMGLGKTHQSMALLAAVMNAKKKTEREKFLIVCPTSVIYHWEDLLGNFLDKGNVLFYHGPFRNNKELNKKGYDIILTTYGIVRSDKELFQKMDFEIAIYDEIQVAKNQKSQIHQTLKKLNTKMNLALTGTPIENSLSELKSLFDIVLPKYLPSETEFREKFSIPIEKDRNIEANKLLSALIKPFVLRRKKQDVLDDLPEKIEEISLSELFPKQRELYVNVATRAKETLDEEDKHFHMHVFALLNKLKQICNHPALYHDDIKNYKDYESGKWELFVELLEESRRSKQKVVVFTQYLGMMDIFEMYLEELGIKYSAIRGSTSNRREQVTRFQKDPEYEVFVGSLNAAGVGIDLTAASVVIHYDRWWNPARENQATDRVHRMGQSKGVSVFKFVTKHSLEEHIHNIIERKAKLIETIVGYDSEDDFKKLDRNELKQILKKIGEDI